MMTIRRIRIYDMGTLTIGPPYYVGIPKLMSEEINHPPHYTFSSIEAVDAIEAWDLEWHEGNVVKYIVRAKHKDNRLEDLQKAAWYLNRKIALLEKEQSALVKPTDDSC